MNPQTATPMSKVRTYNSWENMRRRCFNPKHHRFARYGGRGITVCQRWKDSFANFLADMGPRPEGKTIDRINNDGNYEPENCRWATYAEQAKDGGTPRRFVTYRGVTKWIGQWEAILGFGHGTLANRLKQGWSLEQAFEIPKREPRKVSPIRKKGVKP
jgi:hypothetical protein